MVSLRRISSFIKDVPPKKKYPYSTIAGYVLVTLLNSLENVYLILAFWLNLVNGLVSVK